MATPAPNDPTLLCDRPTPPAHSGLNIEIPATSYSGLYTPEETLAPEQFDTMPPAEIARAKKSRKSGLQTPVGTPAQGASEKEPHQSQWSAPTQSNQKRKEPKQNRAH